LESTIQELMSQTPAKGRLSERQLEIDSYKEKAETMRARVEETVAERDAL
jgi:hypothetical protein